MTAFREHLLTAQDGLRLYWREYGDRLAPGTPVVCLPGLTRNCKDFHDLATVLAPARRLICPDYRGRGRSEYDRNPRNYEPRVYLQDIRHLLAAAGVHRAIVVGTSMGGILAMALGAMMPTLLAGVVLNDIGPEVGGDGLERILDYIGRDRPQPDWPSAAAHLRTMLPNLSLRGEERWLTLARNTFREGPDGLLHFDWDVRLAEGLRGSAVPDLWPYFRSLRRVPLLAVRGGVSDVLTAATFARMAAERPDMVAVTVPGCGHVPALDEPEVTAALPDFLAGIDAAEGCAVSATVETVYPAAAAAEEDSA